MKLQKNNKFSKKIAIRLGSILLASSMLIGCANESTNAINQGILEEVIIDEDLVTSSQESELSAVIAQTESSNQVEEINQYDKYVLKYPYANWCMSDIFPVLIKDKDNNKKLLETYIATSNRLIHFYDLFTEEELFTIPYYDDFNELDENIKCINAKINQVVIKAEYLKDKEIISIGRAGYEFTFLIDINSKNYNKAWEYFNLTYGHTLTFQEFFMTTEKILLNYVKYVPEDYRVTSDDMGLKCNYSVEDKLADSWKMDENEIAKRIEELNISKDDEDLNFSIGEVQALVMKDAEGNFKILNVTMQIEDDKLHLFELYTQEELFVVPISKEISHNEDNGLFEGLNFNNIDLAIEYFNDKKILYMIDSKQMKFFLMDHYNELCKNDSINYDPVSETIVNISYPNTVIEIGEYNLNIKDFARIYVSLPEGMYVTAKELGFDKEKVKSLD